WSAAAACFFLSRSSRAVVVHRLAGLALDPRGGCAHHRHDSVTRETFAPCAIRVNLTPRSEWLHLSSRSARRLPARRVNTSSLTSGLGSSFSVISSSVSSSLSLDSSRDLSDGRKRIVVLISN